MRAVRRRSRGRHRVPGDGAARGRDAVGTPREGAAAARSDAAVRRRDRRCAGQGSPPGDRAPGPEARQRDADAVGREAARLRSGQGHGARGAAVEPHGHPDAAGSHPGRHDPRHVPVHGARAARRQGSRRADGCLRPRRRAVRDGDREESVRRSEPGLAHHGDHVERAGADLVRAAEPRRRRSIASSGPALPRIPRNAGSRRAT